MGPREWMGKGEVIADNIFVDDMVEQGGRTETDADENRTKTDGRQGRKVRRHRLYWPLLFVTRAAV
jgi:hypothetical protein